MSKSNIKIQTAVLQNFTRFIHCLILERRILYVALILLTKQKELDVLGRLDAILLEIFLDLLAASQSGPLFRGHGTAHLATRCLHKCHPHTLLRALAAKQRPGSGPVATEKTK